MTLREKRKESNLFLLVVEGDFCVLPAHPPQSLLRKLWYRGVNSYSLRIFI